MDKKYELAYMVYSDASIKKIDRKIKLLGNDIKWGTIEFLNFRLVTVIVMFFAILFLSSFGYVLAPVVCITYYFMTEKVMIDDKIKKRSVNIERDAITFFEILSLALDAGRNLEGAISVTVNNTSGILSSEFAFVLREARYGKSLTEAMRDMQKRIPSDNVNNIILSLIESDIYGSSIISNINSQVDYLREKRKMEVKAEISKVPIKISIVSVLFFVPLILIIILAPVLLRYMG